jgi:hypothetical protein
MGPEMAWTAPWCNQDLHFLSDALGRCGMSVTEVAVFLGKEESEVSAKAKGLGIKVRQPLAKAAKAKSPCRSTDRKKVTQQGA